MTSHPPIVDRLISQLEAKGHDGQKAEEIAVEHLTKSGILDQRGQLTALGQERQAMGADGRAKDRAAKASEGKHKPADYRYDARSNTATLKPSVRRR